MTVVALSRPAWRTNSASVAQILALALVAFIPISNSITTVLSILLPVACLCYMDRRTWQQVLRNPTTLAILLFVTFSLCASIYSIGVTKDISLAIRKNTRLLYFIFLLPLFMQQKWRHYANVAFLSAVTLSIIAAIIYTWTFFKDPIFTSLFVAFGIFICAHYSWEFKNARKITVPLALFFIVYLFFIGTGRVGQLLFFALMSLFVYQRVKFTLRAMLPFAIMLAVLVLGLFALPSSFLERQTKALGEIQQYWQMPEAEINHESSLGIRFTLVHNTWDLIQQKPFWGWGNGAFRQAYAQHTHEGLTKDLPRANPHNQYLLTWVELGIPGLILMLSIFVTLGLTFARMRNMDGYLGMGLLFAMLLGCTMNSWLLDVTSAFFFIAMAAVYTAGSLSKQHKKN